MEIKIGYEYKHFKGHIYEIIALGKDSETLEDVVIYKNKETNEVWVRSLEMFVSKVDKEKYPQVEQEYRFQLMK